MQQENNEDQGERVEVGGELRAASERPAQTNRIRRTILFLREAFGPNALAIVSTNAAAVFMILLLLAISLGVSPDGEGWLSLLVTMLGLLVGWGLGIFFAPHGKREASTFRTIAQTVSAFIAGYFFSKLDHFIELTVLTSAGSSLPATRLGLFFGAAMLAALTVFSNRWFYRFQGTAREVPPHQERSAA
ncbi:MAG: hypothetical protein GY711_14630 [bacterium]|nr:hypothetical protein [bacterium]